MPQDEIKDKLQKLVDTLDVRDDNVRGQVSQLQDGYKITYTGSKDALRDIWTLTEILQKNGLTEGKIKELYAEKNTPNSRKDGMNNLLRIMTGSDRHIRDAVAANDEQELPSSHKKEKLYKNILVFRETPQGESSEKAGVTFTLKFTPHRIKNITINNLNTAIEKADEILRENYSDDNYKSGKKPTVLAFAEKEERKDAQTIKNYLQVKIGNILPGKPARILYNRETQTASPSFTINLMPPAGKELYDAVFKFVKEKFPYSVMQKTSNGNSRHDSFAIIVKGEMEAMKNTVARDTKQLTNSPGR